MSISLSEHKYSSKKLLTKNVLLIFCISCISASEQTIFTVLVPIPLIRSVLGWIGTRIMKISCLEAKPSKKIDPKFCLTPHLLLPQFFLTPTNVDPWKLSGHLVTGGLPGISITPKRSAGTLLKLRTHHSVYIIYFWSPCISFTFDQPVHGQVNKFGSRIIMNKPAGRSP